MKSGFLISYQLTVNNGGASTFGDMYIANDNVLFKNGITYDNLAEIRKIVAEKMIKNNKAIKQVDGVAILGITPLPVKTTSLHLAN